MRGWIVRPCLEGLELRTLPSLALMDVPMLALGNAPVARVARAPESSARGAASEVTSAASDADGLDWLLQDLAPLNPMLASGTLSGTPSNTAPSAQSGIAPTESVASTPLTVTLPRDVAISASVATVPATAIAAPNQLPALPPSLHVTAPSPTNPDGDSVPGPASNAAPPMHAATVPFLRVDANSPATVLPAFSPAATAPPDYVQALLDSLTSPQAASNASPANTWTLREVPTDQGAIAAQATVDPNVLDATLWDEASTLPQPSQVQAAATWEVPDTAFTAVPELDTIGVPVPQVDRVDTQTLPAAMTDGALLQRFVAARDHSAFATLVGRYEEMVFGICRRVLGDQHGAEDAMQATFLVLARKAGALDPHRPVAGWLYMVAYHLALRLKAVAARRRRCEVYTASSRPTQADNDQAVDLETQEIYQVLREELHRLPDQHRVPLVLCYLQGRTHAEAAVDIGMPRGSIAKRIGEGLEQLRERLIARGIGL
jgi:RNA polymerase sigma factor (sigma-70 family)